MTFKVSARIAHWGIRLAAVGVALGFGGLSQPAVQAACDNIYCVSGQNGCNSNEHYAYTSTFGTRQGIEHFECVSQFSCDSGHPQCDLNLPAEELDVLEHSATAGDRAKVESILNEYPSLTVNVERSALQQLDCRGNVIAHIPVPLTLINGLSAGDHP
jgi:hypothetical protein